MQYAPFDQSIALEALRRASSGAAIPAAEYNAAVVLLGRLRDQVLSYLERSSPRVRVPSSVGDEREGPLVGWTYGEFPVVPGTPQPLTDERVIAASALGYALRSLRTGHRFLRRPLSQALVPIGQTWPDLAAVVGEPALALASPTGVWPDTMVELDPVAARAGLDAALFAMGVMATGRPEGHAERRQRAAWMAREYAVTSRRAEWLAYAALAGATALGLGLFGAFRRSASSTTAQPANPFGALPSSPYGVPMARF